MNKLKEMLSDVWDWVNCSKGFVIIVIIFISLLVLFAKLFFVNIEVNNSTCTSVEILTEDTTPASNRRVIREIKFNFVTDSEENEKTFNSLVGQSNFETYNIFFQDKEDGHIIVDKLELSEIQSSLEDRFIGVIYKDMTK